MTLDLSSLGWDDSFASHFAGLALPGYRPGRVTRVDRGICTVLAADGADRASLSGGLLAAAARDPIVLPCAGDWVAIRTWPDRRTTIEVVLPRRTAIVRHTAGKEAQGQVLAANLDAIAVVEPMHPAPDLVRIERLLSLAWESGAPPLVVLTKCDVVADPDAVAAQVADAAPGVPVHAVSAQQGTGLSVLLPHVAHGRTLGLLGASGAGKSTLVNALARAELMGTRALRADGKGRHTTTYRALLPMPGGGAVLDTPGIRSVGLFDGATGLDRAFADLAEIASECRFTDCRHDREPDCAVQAALDRGELPPRRLESWRKLQRELAYESRRRDARLAAEERARAKDHRLEVRRLRRVRP